MSYIFTCDYCGDLIEAGTPYATVSAEHTNEKGLRKRERWNGGYVGHYHEPGCWRAVYDAMWLVHDVAQDLEEIPTVTEDVIVAERRRHAGGEPIAAPDPREALRALVGVPYEERREILAARSEIASSEGGIGGLDLPSAIRWALVESAVLMIADVDRMLADGSILDVKGIGRRRADELRALVARYHGQAARR